MSAITSFSLILKTFDWMRLFEGTAIYVKLVKSTLVGIGYFMLLFVTSLFMFGVPMVILNKNRWEDELLIEKTFDFEPADMFINQYLMALGEFNLDNFADKP